MEAEQAVCACGWRPQEPGPRAAIVMLIAIGGSIVLLLIVGTIVVGLSLWRTEVHPMARTVSEPATIAPVPRSPTTLEPPDIPQIPPIAMPRPPVGPEAPDVPDSVKPQMPVALPPVEAPTPESEQDQLIGKLRSPDRAARQAAAEALQAQGWVPQTDAQRALVLVAMDNAQAAERYGGAAFDAWCVALSCGDHYFLAQQAAQSLGHLLDTRAAGPLLSALTKSKDSDVRGAAAKALGQIRDPTTLAAMKQVLAKESDDMVARQLLFAIEKLTQLGDADRLIAALGDDEPMVQLRAAVLRLGQHDDDPPAVAWMEKAIFGDDVEVREKAIAALARTGGPTAIKMLVARVDGPGYDGPNEAIDGLLSVGQPAIDPILEALPKMKPNGRWQMLIGIARFGEPAMPGLTELLLKSSLELKKTAIQVLRGIGERSDLTHKPVEPLVALMMNDPDAPIRRSAASALENLKWEPANEGEKEAFEKAK
jgi:HEAT repeat protein